MIMHLHAVEAFSTAFISKLGIFSGSFKYFPKFMMIASSAYSTLNPNSYSSSLLLLSSFIEAAHQSTYILRVYWFLTFYVGLEYMIRQRALMTTLIMFGGFFIAFSRSSCFLSSTLRASSAALRAGMASAKSA